MPGTTFTLGLAGAGLAADDAFDVFPALGALVFLLLDGAGAASGISSSGISSEGRAVRKTAITPSKIPKFSSPTYYKKLNERVTVLSFCKLLQLEVHSS